MEKDGEVCPYVLNIWQCLCVLLVAVVRTGDHTFIGLFTFINCTWIYFNPRSGQIANLTGSESGNESPLAVEMYVCLL